MDIVVDFPTLAVLQAVASMWRAEDRDGLADTGVFAAQHLLASTGSLFETLLQLGVTSDNVTVVGKAYSTCDAVAANIERRGIRIVNGGVGAEVGCFGQAFQDDVDRAWEEFIHRSRQNRMKRIVVLDDGGHALSAAARAKAQMPIVGIEQTTSGLGRIGHGYAWPIIGVASAAVKKAIEPPLIAEAVVEKCRADGVRVGNGKKCSVLGLGHIGRAMTSNLIAQGCVVRAYDRQPIVGMQMTGCTVCDSLKLAVAGAELVFGCTGDDVLHGTQAGLQGVVTLASCSSEDREFLAVLRQARNQGVLQGARRMNVLMDGAQLQVLRGGFPVNFDGSSESVPSSDIQVTRGLLLGGVLQAVRMLLGGAEEDSGASVMLAPAVQTEVVKAWFDARPVRRADYTAEIVSGSQDHSWVAQVSDGRQLDWTRLSFRR